MFLQESLMIIDSIFDEYRSSKNIFIRKRKLNKHLNRLKGLIEKRCTKIDYDIIKEFIMVYNSTYDTIKIPKLNNLDLTVVDDESSNIKMIFISDEKSEFYISLKSNRVVNVTIRHKSDINKIPVSHDFCNVISYVGDDKKISDSAKVTNIALSIFIEAYIDKYIENKWRSK